MRLLLSILAGFTAAITSIVALIVGITKMNGEDFNENLKIHYEEAMAAGRQAAADRRKELEDELTEMNTVSSSESQDAS